MIKKTSSIAYLIICIIGLSVIFPQASLSGSVKKNKPIKITGTFSDLEYAEGPGDLAGTEIRIVEAGSGYQATVQIAEGGPGRLELVDVTIKDNEISFTISPASLWAGTFKGRITASSLKGTFVFTKANKDNQVEEVNLPRRKSYWD